MVLCLASHRSRITVCWLGGSSNAAFDRATRERDRLGAGPGGDDEGHDDEDPDGAGGAAAGGREGPEGTVSRNEPDDPLGVAQVLFKIDD